MFQSTDVEDAFPHLLLMQVSFVSVLPEWLLHLDLRRVASHGLRQHRDLYQDKMLFYKTIKTNMNKGYTNIRYTWSHKKSQCFGFEGFNTPIIYRGQTVGFFIINHLASIA